MELIRKLEGIKNKKGKWVRFAEFLCSFCNEKVIRNLENGLKQKSCGCVAKELKSIGNKGKKRTEEQNKRNSESQKGKKLTDETKQKIREATKGENNPMYGKRFFGELNPNYGKGDKIRGEKNYWYGRYGKDHPAYGNHHTEETKQKISLANKDKIYTEEIRQKISKTLIENGTSKGENNPMYGVHLFGELNSQWQGGKSFEVYPKEFKVIKKFIVKRDNYTCQHLGCTEIHDRLHVHHIDYNKNNNNPENLITLGISCHVKTNFNRDYWTNYYQNIMLNRLIDCLL